MAAAGGRSLPTKAKEKTMTESLPLPETVEIEVLPEDYEKAVFYDNQRKTAAS
jgi:hypothetical protein